MVEPITRSCRKNSRCRSAPGAGPLVAPGHDDHAARLERASSSATRWPRRRSRTPRPPVRAAAAPDANVACAPSRSANARFSSRAPGHPHPHPRRAAQLHQRGRDAAGRALHEHRLARPQTRLRRTASGTRSATRCPSRAPARAVSPAGLGTALRAGTTTVSANVPWCFSVSMLRRGSSVSSPNQAGSPMTECSTTSVPSSQQARAVAAQDHRELLRLDPDAAQRPDVVHVQAGGLDRDRHPAVRDLGVGPLPDAQRVERVLRGWARRRRRRTCSANLAANRRRTTRVGRGTGDRGLVGRGRAVAHPAAVPVPGACSPCWCCCRLCWVAAAAIDRLCRRWSRSADRAPRDAGERRSLRRCSSRRRGQRAEDLRAARVDPHVGQLVAPGAPAVDDHDRHRRAGARGGRTAARTSRSARSRRPAAPRRRPPRVDHRVRPVHPLPRHVLAEEHHVRLEQPAAAGAAGEPEAVGGRQLGVAVRCGLDRGARPPRRSRG